MSRLKIYVFYIPFVLLFISCNSKQSNQILDDEQYVHYIVKGENISSNAQKSLLAEVSGALNKGGSSYAVAFCNSKAIDLTDSLAQDCSCTIHRISDRNRNAHNALKTKKDSALWIYYEAAYKSHKIHDTVVVEDDRAIYYKPIIIGMEACLKCHGSIESIEGHTYGKIKELYPDDKAIGYNLNELRGLWKIEFDL